jgi:hypothetical protein
MPKPSLKHGPSGVSNAKAQPYRLVGGSHNAPRFFQPAMVMARQVQPSDFRQTATYATGVQGGILAKLVMKQALSAEEMELIGWQHLHCRGA